MPTRVSRPLVRARGEVPRFRRRLTAAFVLVAASAAGMLALVTYTLAAGYRVRSFESRCHEEAELALALAPDELSESSFERLQGAYESRTGASTIARSAAGIYTSAPDLREGDIPAALRDPPDDEGLVSGDTTVDGVDRYVLAASRQGDEYWFFFSREPVQSSLAELRVVLAVSWLVTVAGAALIGDVMSRRTLRPVREASEAARSLAAGLLETRLSGGSDDEFGTWSSSFNQMAAALQQTIDELERAARREKQFTADIAHELRTPLTSLAAAASVLAEEAHALSDRPRRAAELVVTQVNRMRDLVLELLELARTDAGSEPLEMERLQVVRVLRAVVDPVLVARGRGSEEVRIDAEAGVVVDADRSRVRRILTNLVDNALVHGAPPVEVRACRNGLVVEIEVHDHGPGLSDVDPRRLFDRFAKSDRSRAGGGTGLGLAIAAGHAAAMGWKIDARNDPAGGAVFRVTVPATRPLAEDRSEEVEEVPSGPSTARAEAASGRVRRGR